MQTYRVEFTPEAEDDLLRLFAFIAARSPADALQYTDAVVATCERLARFPHRGTRRDDVRPGMRITHHHGRTIIAFAIDEVSRCVTVLGLYHGGRDFEGELGA